MYKGHAVIAQICWCIYQLRTSIPEYLSRSFLEVSRTNCQQSEVHHRNQVVPRRRRLKLGKGVTGKMSTEQENSEYDDVVYTKGHTMLA